MTLHPELLKFMPDLLKRILHDCRVHTRCGSSIRFALGLLLLAALPGRCLAVEIIAHRGASYDAPENTLASFKLGWKQRADAVELDIHLSKDGQIVIMHDDNPKRTAGLDQKISDLTWAEVRSLDAGQWKDPKWRGERIPTLDEVLATIPIGKRLFIEIKCGPEILPALAEAVTRSGKKPEQIVLIGFSFPAMELARKKFPAHQVYWLAGFKQDKENGTWRPGVDELIAKAKGAGFDGLNVSYKGPIDAAFIQKVKAAGLRMFVWTVNDAVEAKRLANAGVEGITTDRPEWLRDQLK